MKRYTFLILASILTLLTHVCMAQFNKGDKLINVGIGVNSYYNGGIPFTSSFEVGVTKEISVGASFDYLGYRYRVGGLNYGFSAIYLGLRGSFHFSELLDLDTPELDLYAGAGLGFRSFRWRDGSFNGLDGVYGNGVYLGIFAGARYYLNKGIGLFGEVGAGGSGNARLGVAFRF